MRRAHTCRGCHHCLLENAGDKPGNNLVPQREAVSWSAGAGVEQVKLPGVHLCLGLCFLSSVASLKLWEARLGGAWATHPEAEAVFDAISWGERNFLTPWCLGWAPAWGRERPAVHPRRTTAIPQARALASVQELQGLRPVWRRTLHFQ